MDNVKQFPKRMPQEMQPAAPKVVANVPVPKPLVKETFRRFDLNTAARKKSGVNSLVKDYELWSWIKKNVLMPAGFTDAVIESCNIEFKIKSIFAPYIEVTEGADGAVQQIQ